MESIIFSQSLNDFFDEIMADSDLYTGPDEDDPDANEQAVKE